MVYIYIYIYIGIMFMCSTMVWETRVFPGQVISKIQKIVLDASLLNTQHYNVQIKDKWSNPGKRVMASLTPR